jgi:hypothetical protein
MVVGAWRLVVGFLIANHQAPSARRQAPSSKFLATLAVAAA